MTTGVFPFFNNRRQSCDISRNGRCGYSYTSSTSVAQLEVNESCCST